MYLEDLALMCVLGSRHARGSRLRRLAVVLGVLDHDWAARTSYTTRAAQSRRP